MFRDNPSSQRKPEADASFAVCEKWISQPFEIIIGHTHAVIGDCDTDDLLLSIHMLRDRHNASGRHSLTGVLNQIGEGLVQKIEVSQDNDRRKRRDQSYVQSLRQRPGRRDLNDAVQQFRQIDGFLPDVQRRAQAKNPFHGFIETGSFFKQNRDVSLNTGICDPRSQHFN